MLIEVIRSIPGQAISLICREINVSALVRVLTLFSHIDRFTQNFSQGGFTWMSTLNLLKRVGRK